MADTQSPFAVARTLLEQFESGERNVEDFLNALDIFDAHLQQWAEGVESVPDEPERYPEGAELKAASIEGLQLLADAVQSMREYADQGDVELAHAAMDLVQEAEALLTTLQAETRANVAHFEEKIEEEG